jgi:hypothetical protein
VGKPVVEVTVRVPPPEIFDAVCPAPIAVVTVPGGERVAPEVAPVIVPVLLNVPV